MTKYSKEYFTRERIKFGVKGAFNVDSVTDEYLENFRDCGFDLVQPVPANSHGEIRDRLLDFFDENGIEAYLDDRDVCLDMDIVSQYAHHPSYCGTYIKDEPGTDEMPEFAERAKKYVEINGRYPHVNLLPMYANAAQLKYGAGAAQIKHYDQDPQLYYKYCVAWASITPADCMCMDVYPLRSNPAKPTYDKYIENICIFSKAAKEYNKKFYAYIQAFAWTTSVRNPDAQEFIWQMYSMLSFGCTGFFMWRYGGKGDPQEHDIIYPDGTLTDIYYAAKKANTEVKRISDIYIRYNNIGAFNVNCTEQTPYLNMSYPITCDYASFDTPHPLLVGCFEAKEGNGKALTIVNMTELTEKKNISVSFSVTGYDKVTAYIKGEPCVLEKQNGKYEVSLEYGDGVFVTLD